MVLVRAFLPEHPVELVSDSGIYRGMMRVKIEGKRELDSTFLRLGFNKKEVILRGLGFGIPRGFLDVTTTL